MEWYLNSAQSKTGLHDKDYWLPNLTGEMVKWMKMGSYQKFDNSAIGAETIIRKIDKLEGVIDRLMSEEAV